MTSAIAPLSATARHQRLFGIGYRSSTTSSRGREQQMSAAVGGGLD
jgi:hypothetical protein